MATRILRAGGVTDSGLAADVFVLEQQTVHVFRRLPIQFAILPGSSTQPSSSTSIMARVPSAFPLRCLRFAQNWSKLSGHFP